MWRIRLLLDGWTVGTDIFSVLTPFDSRRLTATASSTMGTRYRIYGILSLKAREKNFCYDETFFRNEQFNLTSFVLSRVGGVYKTVHYLCVVLRNNEVFKCCE